MIIAATTSYLLLNLLHCHPIFCGVKELGASQHNLDQLRTLELLKESIYGLYFIMLFIIFLPVLSRAFKYMCHMCHGPLGKLPPL